MRLVCISDTHNTQKAMRLPEGDVLIHAGDATGQGLSLEVQRFLAWFESQPHPHKILIAGNHDWLFQRHPDMATQLLAAHPGITYLQDSGVEIEGVRFWGSPWQPWFCDWAFNLPRKGQALREVWNKIPLDTDALITHGPPHGVLDQVHSGEHLGCEELKIRLSAVKPRVHVFGHIHDSYGVARSKATTFINASTCTEEYRALNRPIVVDINPKSIKVHGTTPNPRRKHLLIAQGALEGTHNGSLAKAEMMLPEGHLIALKELADLRQLAPDQLLQEYVDRGLHSDTAKLLRAENKPSKRTVPVTDLDS